jgi:hypothetical protein
MSKMKNLRLETLSEKARNLVENAGSDVADIILKNTKSSENSEARVALEKIVQQLLENSQIREELPDFKDLSLSEQVELLAEIGGNILKKANKTAPHH